MSSPSTPSDRSTPSTPSPPSPGADPTTSASADEGFPPGGAPAGASSDTVPASALAGRLGGSYPALVTPLSDPHTVDEDGVRQVVTRSLEDGAAGVLIAGTTGEGSLLEPGQRAQATAVARDTVDASGVRPAPLVIAGASAPSMASLHADVARLAAAGADVVLVLPPSLQPLTPDEVADLHLEVAEVAEVPTLAYHIPQLTGSPLTAEALQRLVGHERIIGMKDSSPDADRRRVFAEVADRAEAFVVLTGHAPTVLTALQDGVAGSILALSNLRLRQVVALTEAVAAGDDEAAGRVQESLVRLNDGVRSVGVSVPAFLKAALQLDGVIAERWCTPPLRSVPGGRLDHVRTALLR